MNVTLNMPVDTGVERAGTTGPRANDADAEAGNFGKLFEQVGQATGVDQGPQSGPTSGPEGDPDDPDVATRRTRKHHDGDRSAGGATSEVTPEEVGADTPSGAPIPLPPTAATPAAEVGATGLDASAGQANHTDRANDHVVAVRRFLSGECDESINDAAVGASTAWDGHEPTSQAGPAAASSEPAVAEAQPGSPQVRYWTRSDSIAAFAARQPQTDSPLNGLQGEHRPPSSQAAREPIDVQVTAYERHMAPAGELRASIRTDGAVADENAPVTAQEVEDALQVEAGSTETVRAPRSGQGWRTLSLADRAQSRAGNEPSDRRIAAHDDDRTAVPGLVEQSQQGQASDRESRARGQGLPVNLSHGEERRQAATGVSTAGGVSFTAASVPETTPASPLTAGVASGIANALGSARTAENQAVPARLDTTNDVTAAAPVRSIALNLDMREYGLVDLRISLKGNAVSVRVKADRPETADALQRDEASLRDLLHRAGYEAQQVQIERRDAAALRPGDAAASGQQAGGTGTNAFSGHAAGEESASSREQRPQAQRGADPFVLQDTDHLDAPRQDRYRGPDRLYV